MALGLHAETEAASRLSREEWTASRQEALSTALAARELPMISRFGPAEYDAVAPERMFEFGLGRLLDGIAAMIGSGVSRDTAEAGTQPG